MKTLKFIFLSIILLSLCLIQPSCKSYEYGAGVENVQKSNLTVGVVKAKVKKGETNQSEILELFGAPNLITKNRSNNEVWSYNRMSSVEKGGYTYFTSWDGRASHSSTNQSFDLIITFDENEIVIDYSVISSSY